MKNTWLAFALVVLIGCDNTDDDQITVPAYFEFSEIATLEGTNLNQATGFLGDAEEGVLYVASRQGNPQTGQVAEKVVKYDLSGNILAESYFDQQDFITKRIHLLNGKLVVIGGSYINTYDTDLASPPESIAHGFAISRFGSVVYENELYVWGGDLFAGFSNVIYRWDDSKKVFVSVGELPSAKTYAMGEVYGDRIYIFGGQREFQGSAPEEIIYVFDIPETSVATLSLPTRVARTFTATHEGLILVGGQLTADQDPLTDDFDIFFGAYNPDVFGFTELNTNLSDEGVATLHEMTVVGDRLYVIYGEPDQAGGGLKIMSAQL